MYRYKPVAAIKMLYLSMVLSYFGLYSVPKSFLLLLVKRGLLIAPNSGSALHEHETSPETKNDNSYELTSIKSWKWAISSFEDQNDIMYQLYISYLRRSPYYLINRIHSSFSKSFKRGKPLCCCPKNCRLFCSPIIWILVLWKMK